MSYICMHVCMYVIHMYAMHTYVCMYVCMSCIRMYICQRLYACMCVFVNMNVRDGMCVVCTDEVNASSDRVECRLKGIHTCVCTHC
jgi:hypothetical protein